ncbi:MAG TPA: ABC transporter ATP-binding protein [Cryptosporangiaceae bacterium]|nr:ABC transporter ATP-binding protein [Cryptosporangiaceae bacterium]
MAAIRLDALTKIFPDGTVAVRDLSLEIAPGEFVVLVGPSGCGKSTALRMVAGLESITSGQLQIGSVVANHLPPRRRALAMVFQEYSLYRHMKVRDNIAFPLRMAKRPPAEIAERVKEAATMLGIGDLLDRYPEELSGGQRQRVAMGRALVRKPRAFLMDEPLSNLDAGLRAELRTEIATLTRELGVTTLYVTHDQSEAMTMADRVVVLRAGVLEQVGTPQQVYEHPATLFVAAFFGTPRMNLFQADVHAYLEEEVLLDLGGQALSVPWRHPRARPLSRYHGTRVVVGLRPEALALGNQGSSSLQGRIRHLENHGHEIFAHVDVGSRPVPSALTSAAPPAVERPARRTLFGRLRRGSSTSGGKRRGRHTDAAKDEPAVSPTHTYRAADLVIRTPLSSPVSAGDIVTVRVDADQLHLFDLADGRALSSPRI